MCNFDALVLLVFITPQCPQEATTGFIEFFVVLNFDNGVVSQLNAVSASNYFSTLTAVITFGLL